MIVCAGSSPPSCLRHASKLIYLKPIRILLFVDIALMKSFRCRLIDEHNKRLSQRGRWGFGERLIFASRGSKLPFLHHHERNMKCFFLVFLLPRLEQNLFIRGCWLSFVDTFNDWHRVMTAPHKRQRFSPTIALNNCYRLR